MNPLSMVSDGEYPLVTFNGTDRICRRAEIYRKSPVLKTITFFGFVAVGLSLIPTLVHRKMHIVVPWEIHFFDRPHAVSSYWRILISLVP